MSGVPARAIGEDALATLQAADWPGNVRQLRNVIERILILATGDPMTPVTVDALPPEAWPQAGFSKQDGLQTVIGLPLRDARERFDAELADERDAGVPWLALCDRIVAELPQLVYVSFDIDGLDPALCPHTGTPVPGGLRWNEALSLLQAVVRSGRRIVGFDLTEVAPGPDPADEWDANVGARALYKLIGFALLSQQRPA